MSHLDELLSVYLDGEANPAESARVVSHVRECLGCRRRMVDLSAARSAVRSLPMLEVPSDFLPLAPAAGRSRSRSRRRVGAVAAALAAIVAAATLATPGPEPIDLSDLSRQLRARASLDSGAGPLKVVVPVGRRE